jgi:hypothetical protein
MTYRLACLAAIVMVLTPRGAVAYSVLAHESNIDGLWDSHIRPVLLAKYPGTSADAWREARPTPTVDPPSRLSAIFRSAASFSRTSCTM